jgi:hypothetical protein
MGKKERNVFKYFLYFLPNPYVYVREYSIADYLHIFKTHSLIFFYLSLNLIFICFKYRSVIKWKFKKYDPRMWTEFVWLKTGTSEGLL